jgi:formylmethanofuran dehydrogenase subunit E
MALYTLVGIKMEYDLPSVAEWFHGHYQPYIALGIRMGNLAMQLLDAKRHELFIVSETGTKPTYSCMTDGLQLVTGSTIGNGRLKINENATLAATFSKEKRNLKIQSKEFKFDIDFITNAKSEDLFDWELE